MCRPCAAVGGAVTGGSYSTRGSSSSSRRSQSRGGDSGDWGGRGTGEGEGVRRVAAARDRFLKQGSGAWESESRRLCSKDMCDNLGHHVTCDYLKEVRTTASPNPSPPIASEALNICFFLVFCPYCGSSNVAAVREPLCARRAHLAPQVCTAARVAPVFGQTTSPPAFTHAAMPPCRVVDRARRVLPRGGPRRCCPRRRCCRRPRGAGACPASESWTRGATPGPRRARRPLDDRARPPDRRLDRGALRRVERRRLSQLLEGLLQPSLPVATGLPGLPVGGAQRAAARRLPLDPAVDGADPGGHEHLAARRELAVGRQLEQRRELPLVDDPVENKRSLMK